MTMVKQLFSFPALTLAAAAESLVAIKLFPNYYSHESHLTVVVTLLAFNYALGILFWGLVYPNFISPLRYLPGPRSVVSLAHRTLVTMDRPSGELFLELRRKYPDQDLINLTFLRKHVLVANPKLFADLLVHRSYDFAKPGKIRSFLRHVLGNGLIIVEGDQHKFLRKNTMPAFHFRHIKELYPMMMSKANILTNAIKEEISNNPVDEKDSAVVELTAWASKVTIDIIGIAGLGRKFNVVEKRKDPLGEIYEALLDPSREKLVFAMLALGLGLKYVQWIPWKMNDLFKYLTGSLDNICMPMIKEKRQAISERGDDHFDVLSLLIKSGNFSDQELKDQLLTFLAAGHETTASAMTWACYLLAKAPHLQSQLREEIKNAATDGPMSDSTEDLAGILEQLPLLNGIMMETFRLYPTVPMTMREALCDSQLGDQMIPKGTVMILSMWMINRSPEIWGPDASSFRPDRWINEGGKPNQTGGASSNYDFLTFLHGPRSCIGQSFAKAEMRCLLANMVQSFTWELAMNDELVLPRGVITIKPAHGMYLRMTPIEQATADARKQDVA